MGELLSLIFSMVYTRAVNKQMRFAPPENNGGTETREINSTVDYFTELERYRNFKWNRAKSFKQRFKLKIRSRTLVWSFRTVSSEADFSTKSSIAWFSKKVRRRRSPATNQVETVVPGSSGPSTPGEERIPGSLPPNRPLGVLLAYIPLTSKYFYWMIARDYVAKKISHPFFLVCHCMIVLDTGWEKFPLIPYFKPMVKFLDVFVPRREKRTFRPIW